MAQIENENIHIHTCTYLLIWPNVLIRSSWRESVRFVVTERLDAWQARLGILIELNLTTSSYPSVYFPFLFYKRKVNNGSAN